MLMRISVTSTNIGQNTFSTLPESLKFQSDDRLKLYFKWANPASFSLIFVISNFTTNRYVKKYPSSIRCQDSNSRPLKQESPIITTRPGLPPYRLKLCELKNPMTRFAQACRGSYFPVNAFP